MKKIMLVDDEKDQIYVIKTTFEKLFRKEYIIIPAESGEKCFELLQKEELPDLVLLDIIMPDMDITEPVSTRIAQGNTSSLITNANNPLIQIMSGLL